MKEQVILEGRIVNYIITGKGNPVVLLHGFGEDSNIWKFQLEALAVENLLMIPDLPGSGASEPIADMSIEGLAKWLFLFLQNTGILPPQPLVMIGHSMGGYITLAYAALFPENLLAFGLVHSTAFADTEEKKELRQRSIAFIRKNGSANFLAESIPNLFTEQYRKQNSANVLALVDQYRYFNKDSLIAYYESMIQRPDRTGVLHSFTRPILFIIGKNDKAVPFEDSVNQCGLPQVSYIHVLEASAHMGMMEEQEKCNKALRSFIHDVNLTTVPGV